jgi:glyoxylase-like metal-dependent hydrolase (beta-lactamase superfamily II)
VTRHNIRPVEIGRRKADSALFLYLTDFDVEIEIAYRRWILRSADGLIVVDTGPPLEEAHRRGITQVRDIDAALDEAGVKGAEVRTIVLTHLHWDHAANAGKFPNAVYLTLGNHRERGGGDRGTRTRPRPSASRDLYGP